MLLGQKEMKKEKVIILTKKNYHQLNEYLKSQTNTKKENADMHNTLNNVNNLNTEVSKNNVNVNTNTNIQTNNSNKNHSNNYLKYVNSVSTQISHTENSYSILKGTNDKYNTMMNKPSESLKRLKILNTNSEPVIKIIKHRR